MKKIVVLISGNGSNLQAIIDATQNSTLPDTKIVQVISNKLQAQGLQRAINAKIPTELFEFHKGEKRTVYDRRLAQHIKTLAPDLIVLAGWMRILTNDFLKVFNKGQVINLHPALPGQFAGSDGIGDAFRAYQQGLITHTGLMIHEVVEEVDCGRVLETESVEIKPSDTLESLTKRVQSREKLALLNAIYKKLFQPQHPEPGSVYVGKVRQMHDLGYNLLAMEHSDRLSAFDRQICTIPGKGRLLLETSKWWFDHTRHIVDNHYIWHDSNVMVVKKCTPILLEMVVRGYITGSTKTSLWTHYAKGVCDTEGKRVPYCGHIFPEGLEKNQKLPHNVVTPTTKGETDELISEEEIIKRKIVSQEVWDEMHRIALELFSYGQSEAQKRGLILVDTKYEFGFCDGKLTLMDEIHTPDSSRYWMADTYKSRMWEDLSPERLDKDAIREYLKTELKWTPYNKESEVPPIPKDLVERTFRGYGEVLQRFTGQDLDRETFKVYQPFDVTLEKYWNQIHSPTLLVICGSKSDQQFVNKMAAYAKELGIYSRQFVASAHKSPEKVLGYIKDYNNRDGRFVWICVAGRSNALGGFVASNSRYPAISCPPFKDKSDMMVNIQSSLQMPSNVPSMIVLDPKNAVLAAKKIFDLV